MISAVFQIPENVEDEREALMIDVTKGSMIGRQSLITVWCPLAAGFRMQRFDCMKCSIFFSNTIEPLHNGQGKWPL